MVIVSEPESPMLNDKLVVHCGVPSSSRRPLRSGFWFTVNIKHLESGVVYHFGHGGSDGHGRRLEKSDAGADQHVIDCLLILIDFCSFPDTSNTTRKHANYTKHCSDDARAIFPS